MFQDSQNLRERIWDNFNTFGKFSKGLGNPRKGCTGVLFFKKRFSIPLKIC
jgi:hypothetical protein